MSERSPYTRMAFTLLALIGIFDSLYLSFERATGGNVICPTGGGCETVAASPYSVLFGVFPVSYLGVIAYTGLFIIGMLSLHYEEILNIPLPLVLLIIASCGISFSIYLVYLQIAIIQAICFWCMISAVCELGIWVAALLNWRDYRLLQLDGI